MLVYFPTASYGSAFTFSVSSKSNFTSCLKLVSDKNSALALLLDDESHEPINLHGDKDGNVRRGLMGAGPPPLVSSASP